MNQKTYKILKIEKNSKYNQMVTMALQAKGQEFCNAYFEEV
jgi:hypothetical protein